MKAVTIVIIAKFVLHVKNVKTVHAQQYVNHALDVLHQTIVLTVQAYANVNGVPNVKIVYKQFRAIVVKNAIGVSIAISALNVLNVKTVNIVIIALIYVVQIIASIIKAAHKKSTLNLLVS